MSFVAKLNRRTKPYVISDEVVTLTDGKAAAFLQHDNVNLKTLEIFTQPQRGGQKVLNYTTQIRQEAEWKVWLQVFAPEDRVYVSYETLGDTVEAEDVNELQSAIASLDAALETERQRTDAHRSDYNNPHRVTKAQVGLSAVDNTADLAKPVSTAQRTAIDAVSDQLTSHVEQADNPHNVTKAQVGLGLADNTPDAEKPVSAAQRAAIDKVSKEASAGIDRVAAESEAGIAAARAEAAAGIAQAEATAAQQLKGHTDRTDNPHGVTKVQVGLGAADNTSDVDKPVSTAQRAAIDHEAETRASADAALRTDLTAETNARVTADTKLRTDLASETQERIAADTALNDAIGAEVTARSEADTALRTALQGNIDAVAADLTTHTGDAVRHLTAAERQKWNDKYTKAEVDNKFSTLETAIDWKESVATFADIATAYPQPEDGWTVNVKDTDYTYRYSGTQWVAISANSIPKATQAVDGLLTKEDKALLDDAAAKRHTHSNKSVLDTITAALIDGWNSAVTHISDAVKHITAAERMLWNTVSNKVDKVTGKSLSTNDYTTAEKEKLAGMVAGANKTIVNNTLTSDSTTEALSAAQGKVLKTAVDGKAAASHTHSYAGSSSAGGVANSAAKLATARTVDGVSFDGTVAIAHFGTCSTAAATVAKTVALPGFVLVTGAEITVKFTVTNTAANPTLNVNGTGAKPLYYRGTAIAAAYLAANRTYRFCYDGTSWNLVGDFNTNSDTKVTQSTSTTANVRPLMMGSQNTAEGGVAIETKTDGIYGAVGLYGQPSTASLYAKRYALLNGNTVYGSTRITTVGTDTATGVSEMVLGNGTAAGTTNNSRGQIALYGTNTGYTYLTPGNNTTSNYTLTLPAKTGTLATTADNVASASKAAQLTTARTIALSGGATGTATAFNGTANISIPVTALDPSKLSAAVPVAKGGTGATTAAAARTALGAAATSHTHNYLPTGGLTWNQLKGV